MSSRTQVVTSHFLKECITREIRKRFSQNKLELIFVYGTANFIYRLNFPQEKKASLGIWNNVVKTENVNTTIQHQACTKMKSILDKFWLSRLQVNVQQI